MDPVPTSPRYVPRSRAGLVVKRWKLSICFVAACVFRTCIVCAGLPNRSTKRKALLPANTPPLPSTSEVSHVGCHVEEVKKIEFIV